MRNGMGQSRGRPGRRSDAARNGTGKRYREQQRRAVDRVAREWAFLEAEARRLGVLGPVGSHLSRHQRDQLLALKSRAEKLRQDAKGLTGRAAAAGLHVDVLLKLIAVHLDPRKAPVQAHGSATQLANAQEPLRRGWNDVASDLVLKLSDLWSLDIRLSVEGGSNSMMIRIDRVLSAKSFCVAWQVLDSLEEARLAQQAGWILWRPDREIEVKRWRGKTEPAELAETGHLFATIRHAEIRPFAKQVVGCLDAQGLDPMLVRVRSDEASGTEYQRRMSELGLLERRSHRQASNDDRPILGHCRNCGQPLTDPVSARRGYGPVCMPRDGTRHLKAPSTGEASITYRIAGTPLIQWRRMLHVIVDSLF